VSDFALSKESDLAQARFLEEVHEIIEQQNKKFGL
jgi:hypothetical protein